ncbi:MAG: hypothetical protein ACE5FU_08505 [Nitrospinota bacterium]
MTVKLKPLIRVLAVTVFVIVFAHLAHAQINSIERIRHLTIELMPEFDREGILVIYKGTLVPDTPLPATVSFSLSSDIHLNAVAFKSRAKNKLLMGQYQARTEGNSTMLDITATDDNFWVEFYTSKQTIKKDGDLRKFSYTWRGSIAVDEITWSVQQPANGTGLKVEPEGGVMTRDDYGLPTYKVAMPKHPANTPATLDVTYRKPDNVFTSSVLGPPAKPETQSFPPQQTFQGGGQNRQTDATKSFTPLIIIVGITLAGLIFIIARRKR